MREEWTAAEIYQHVKETITKALGIEQHKNKYLDKYSDELEEVIRKKKDAFHIEREDNTYPQTASEAEYDWKRMNTGR